MRRFSYLAVVVAAGGVGILFCACSGVPDVTFGDAGASGSSSGTSSGLSSTGGSGSSSGSSSGGPSDAAPDAPPCKSTGAEICGDGIDNDCNGKTDCADDACTPTSECVDPAPPGWTLVSFADATRPTCATGYDTPLDLKVVAGTGAGTCTCACNPTTGTACSAGAFSVAVDASTCSAAPTSLPHNTSCTTLASSINMPNGQSNAEATPPAGPSACGGTTSPAGGGITSGRTCAVAATTKLGKGCTTATQLCAPKAAGFGFCITKLGTDACPAPYTRQETAGSTATDNRTCNTCTCDAKACTGTVELFEAGDCGAGGKSTGAIGPTCNATLAKNFTAIRYKTTLTQTGCAIASGGFNNAMTGTITWTDQRVVCCKPP